MTLGRTSSGSIKIKTDEAGGGLRAVECACCDAAPCEDYSFNGKIITKEAYNSWRKGGTIQVSGNVFDGDAGRLQSYSTGEVCYNGECSWSYSNTIIVPPNTCVFQFSDTGGAASCQSNYYGQTMAPFIFLQASAFKSKDDPEEVYRARIWLTIGCPYLYFLNPCDMDMCLYNTTRGLGNTQFDSGDASISFLGIQYNYISDLGGSGYANLNFSFTPNP